MKGPTCSAPTGCRRSLRDSRATRSCGRASSVTSTLWTRTCDLHGSALLSSGLATCSPSCISYEKDGLSEFRRRSRNSGKLMALAAFGTGGEPSAAIRAELERLFALPVVGNARSGHNLVIDKDGAGFEFSDIGFEHPAAALLAFHFRTSCSPASRHLRGTSFHKAAAADFGRLRPELSMELLVGGERAFRGRLRPALLQRQRFGDRDCDRRPAIAHRQR